MRFHDVIRRLEEKHGCMAGCVLWDAARHETLARYREEQVFKSASLIKTPIMLCALEEVEAGRLSLDGKIDVPPRCCVGDEAPIISGGPQATLAVLLEYMITQSNNSATNVLIDLLGMEKVNAFSRKIGLKDTVLRRHMLDFDAARRGMENNTTAGDMSRLYAMLLGGETLTPFMRDAALPILLRQEDKELILSGDPSCRAAHKTGGLSDIAHDAGILYGENRTLIFAVLSCAPDERQCVAFQQELSPHVLAAL